MESFLHWIKLENEIKMTEKIKKPHSSGDKYVLPCAQSLQPQLWREPPALMETHCLPVLVKHSNNPAKTVSSDLTWAEISTHGTRTAIQPRSDICVAITSFSLRLRRKTERFPIFIPPRCLVSQTAARPAGPAARWSL